ncbi:unnamed protein product [Peniophora sp. CBMAI 1063]|nr:unnamed protein product [Peniophora sp. CBMAI 1063]
MTSTSRSFHANEPVYYTEDITIVDPLEFDPVLSQYVDLVRLKGLPSPRKPGVCTVTKAECKVVEDSSETSETTCAFILSISSLTRCTFRMKSAPFKQEFCITIQTASRNVLVNAKLLQPGEVHPLTNLDCIELFDSEGDEHRRFQLRLAPVVYDPEQKATYTPIRELGRGGQGMVWECGHPKNLERVAVKVIRRRVADTSDRCAPVVEVSREVAMLKKVWVASAVHSYRNTFKLPEGFLKMSAKEPSIPIIPFRGSWTIWGADFIVLSMAAGDLEKWCDNIKTSTRSPPTEMQTCAVAIQIFDALRYIHKQGLVHADLKPGNILVMDREFYPRVVVSDFGLCMEEQDIKVFVEGKHGAPGTRMFVPPESMLSPANPHPTAGTPNDIWAAGLTLQYLFTCGYFHLQPDRVTPLEEYTDAFFEKLYIYYRRSGVSRNAINVLERCFRLDPTKRLTAKGAFGLTWFRDFRPIEPGVSTQKTLTDSPSSLVEAPLDGPGVPRDSAHLGAKRPLSDSHSEIAESGKSKGKAPAHKRRDLLAG